MNGVTGVAMNYVSITLLLVTVAIFVVIVVMVVRNVGQREPRKPPRLD
jgi:hypothetical protein